MIKFCILLVAVIVAAWARRTDDDSWRLVGGGTATKGAYPWQVSLSVHEPFGNRIKHICGGSIVASQWVLTASHCVNDNKDASHYVVVVGEHDNKKEEGTEQRFDVLKIIMHKKFNSRTYQNDVTLLHLDRPITLNKYASIIPMATPSLGLLKGNEDCRTSGWGDLSFQGHHPNLLQELSMPLVPHQDCKDLYKDTGIVSEDMMCAGYVLGQKGVCMGDSGGPLVCEINGETILVGVTSWGVGCAEVGHPGAFARVDYFYGWIKEHMASGK